MVCATVAGNSHRARVNDIGHTAPGRDIRLTDNPGRRIETILACQIIRLMPLRQADCAIDLLQEQQQQRLPLSNNF